MAIANIKNPDQEVKNEGNKSWKSAGVYEVETGLFYLREIEQELIKNHF